MEAIADAPLETLVVIRQRRLQRDVGAGSSLVELSLDEVEVVGAAAAEPWVELEAELRAGSEADLAAIGGLLLARRDLLPATSSKLDRALAALDARR
jgi:inorganic triphosphatase YgiF